MEDNKKFELNDNQLDEVAGGFGSCDGQSLTYCGVTLTPGQTVRLRCCLGSACSAPVHNAVITGFGTISHRGIKTGAIDVHFRMECCNKEVRKLVRLLLPDIIPA